MIIVSHSANMMYKVRYILVIILMRRAEKAVTEESREGPFGCGVDNL